MAQIKIDPKIVVMACEKAVEFFQGETDRFAELVSFKDDIYESSINECLEISEFAKIAINLRTDFFIDLDDYSLIGEYFPEPVTYHSPDN